MPSPIGPWQSTSPSQTRDLAFITKHHLLGGRLDVNIGPEGNPAPLTNTVLHKLMRNRVRGVLCWKGLKKAPNSPHGRIGAILWCAVVGQHSLWGIPHGSLGDAANQGCAKCPFQKKEVQDSVVAARQASSGNQHLLNHQPSGCR